MHPTELFEELKKHYGVTSDADISIILGLTSGRISQLRTRPGNLTARQIVSFIQKAAANERSAVLSNGIKPIVELYPIKRISSKRDVKWESLPTGPDNPRNRKMRSHLESVQGIYIFYDSQGCAIYAGKTERQNIWKEMTNAYNRERSNHNAVLVDHTGKGEDLTPAWQWLKQPRKTQVYLYDTSLYFSAYEVAVELIPKLEAFVVRAFCNSLSNKKMEKL